MIDRGRIGWDMVMSKMLALNSKWQQFRVSLLLSSFAFLQHSMLLNFAWHTLASKSRLSKYPHPDLAFARSEKGLRIHNPTEITKVVEAYQVIPVLKEDTREI